MTIIDIGMPSVDVATSSIDMGVPSLAVGTRSRDIETAGEDPGSHDEEGANRSIVVAETVLDDRDRGLIGGAEPVHG